MLMLTNNPKAAAFVRQHAICELKTVEGYIEEVLIEARNLVHKGHRLLTHPLSGSVKPNHGLYKSVLLSKQAYARTDPESLQLIEGAIESLRKLHPVPIDKRKQYDADFMLIDFTLIMSALDIGVQSHI